MNKQTWTKATPNFHKDLSVGRIGELALIHACNGTLEPTDGREGDARIVGTKNVVEIKTDSYDMDRTTNFFMEKYRSGNRPGGAWQSLEHGCKYFIYCFSQNAEIFVFNTAALVDRLNLLHDSKNLTLTSVGNGSYTTRGLKVHRDWVTDLMLDPASVGLDWDKAAYEYYINFNKAEAK